MREVRPCRRRCLSHASMQLHDRVLYFADSGRVAPVYGRAFKRALTDGERRELRAFFAELKQALPQLPERQELWLECGWRGACYRAQPEAELKAPADYYRRDTAVVVRWKDNGAADGSKYYGQIRFFLKITCGLASLHLAYVDWYCGSARKRSTSARRH